MLNETQQKAVDMQGTDLVVFASAGAGKTTVLVKRLLKRIIKDGLALDEIVAMTFTEAAASEIKDRLRQSLMKAKSNDDGDTDFLQRQIAALDSADISTIHSFCLSIIKNYYYTIGLTKKMTETIIDSAKEKELSDIVLEKIIKEEIEKDKERFLDLTKALSSETFSFEDFKKTIRKIYDTAMTSVDPLLWLDDMHQDKQIKKLEDIDDGILDLYRSNLYDAIKQAKGVYERIIKIDDYAKRDDLKERIKELEMLLDDKLSYSMLIERIVMTSDLPKANSKDEEYKKLRKSLEDIYKDLAKELLKEQTMIKYEDYTRQYANYLLDITKRYLLEYRSIKRENECLDFDDLEHFAYEILKKDDGKVAKILKERYKEIMIDEFQDTSSIQYAIASAIADKDLFIVGDIKQSIYRFRSARPDIMRSIRDDANFEVIDIKENYRSKSSIIDFNNSLFKILMGNDFSEADAQNVGNSSQSEDNVPISFELFIQDKEDTERLVTKKARLLASVIKDRHDDGTPFKDICVLVRSHTEKIEIKKALDRSNIPYFMEDSSGYLDTYPIEVIKAYLTLLEDNDDKIALVATLRSLYGLSDDDLVKIAPDFTKLPARFKEDLAQAKNILIDGDIFSLLSFIYEIDGFYDSLPDNEKADLDMLIEDVATNKMMTIFKILEYIEAILDIKKGDSAFAISKDADVVKVMTIHHSKGLQFDTVIIYGQSSNLLKETRDPVIFDKKFGLGLKIRVNDKRQIYETLRRKAIKTKNSIEDLKEYSRLFYVATTRAKRELIIVDAIKEVETYDDIDVMIKARKGFTSYLLSLEDKLAHFTIKHHFMIKDETPYPKKIEIAHTSRSRYTQKDKKEVIKPSKHSSHITLFLDNRAMSYGTKMHELLEHIDLDTPVLPLDLSLKEKEAIECFLKDPLIKEAKKGTVYREVPFYLRDDRTIDGIMDFVSILNDKVILIDYKTDALDDENQFIERYDDQLMTYQKILKMKFDRPIETYIYSLHLARFIKL